MSKVLLQQIRNLKTQKLNIYALIFLDSYFLQNPVCVSHLTHITVWNNYISSTQQPAVISTRQCNYKWPRLICINHPCYSVSGGLLKAEVFMSSSGDTFPYPQQIPEAEVSKGAYRHAGMPSDTVIVHKEPVKGSKCGLRRTEVLSCLLEWHSV